MSRVPGLPDDDPLRTWASKDFVALLGGLVDSWRPRARASAISEHLRKEIAAARRRGHEPGEPPILPAGAPVPTCRCVTCVTRAVGGTDRDVLEAQMAMTVLAGLPGPERIATAEAWEDERRRIGREARLPPATVLAAIAARLPGAVRHRGPSRQRWGKGSGWEDRVRRARALSVFDVAARLGCGEPLRRGREIVMLCPLHDDHDPSLRIAEDGRVWYCDPCGEGGDALQLWMRACRVGFPETVEALVG